MRICNSLALASLFLSATLLPNAAQAGYGAGLVTIPIFMPDGKVFVTPSTPLTSPAACNTTNRFVIDSTTAGGKSMVAALLMAKAMGSTVFFAGTTFCTLFQNAEDLTYIQVTN